MDYLFVRDNLQSGIEQALLVIDLKSMWYRSEAQHGKLMKLKRHEVEA